MLNLIKIVENKMLFKILAMHAGEHKTLNEKIPAINFLINKSETSKSDIELGLLHWKEKNKNKVDRNFMTVKTIMRLSISNMVHTGACFNRSRKSMKC